MTGEHAHESAESVRAYWLAHATNIGFRSRQSGVRTHELTRTELESEVYVSAGRYVADCSNPNCASAAAAWTENPECCCLACGYVFKPRWPDAELRLAAVEVLLERVNPEWRNWGARPHAPHESGTRYETLAELKVENLTMGDALPGGPSPQGSHPLGRVAVG